MPACLLVGWVSALILVGSRPMLAYILAYLHTAICSFRLVRGACVAQGVKKDPSRSCGAVETDRKTDRQGRQLGKCVVSVASCSVCVWVCGMGKGEVRPSVADQCGGCVALAWFEIFFLFAMI